MSRSLMSRLLAGSAVSLCVLCFAGVAAAQDAQQTNSTAAGTQAAAGDELLDEIIVTGTFIRGVAPVGTNVLSVSAAEVTASGAGSANQVLGKLPQITNFFNSVPTPGALSFFATQRPNLRDLGGDATGTATLVLLDGHRMVNAGHWTAPDPDVIPPGMIQRVEVVPDGGSATYGSDAVGGVINFVTRERFDGVMATARQGFADNFRTFDANLTAGKDWGSGSAYVSYAYAENDSIFGRDRDYVQQIAINRGYCAPGTRVVAGVTYALPSLTPNTITDCDATDDTTIVPRLERHSVFAGLMQELNESVTLNVKGFYTKRRNVSSVDPDDIANFGGRAQTVTLQPTNPSYRPVIAGDTRPQEIRFSYSGLIDPEAHLDMDVYQFTPSVTADIGSDWQLRVLGSYGASESNHRSVGVNANAQTAAVASGALNPYNLAGASAATLAAILDPAVADTNQEQTNLRSTLEGSLFALPGGNVRLAIGAESLREEYKTHGIASGVVTNGQNKRNVKSAFAEVIVPVFGAANTAALAESLTLSAAGRYDDYSDFGDTFNPKLGATWKPTSWASIRGNWGKSFNAPSLADASAADSRVSILPISLFIKPGDSPLNQLRPSALLAGGNVNLRPQKAETWSIGTELTPADGLYLSATYYNAEVRDQFSFPQTSQIHSPAYQNVITFMNPSPALISQLTAGMRLDGNAALLNDPARPVYQIIDARRQNLGTTLQEGIDFLGSYEMPTDFGSVNASVGGTYILKRDVALVKGTPLQNALKTPGTSRLSIQGTLGVVVDKVTASVTYNHRAGYDMAPALTDPLSRFPAQDHVDSFDTVDLFFAYDIKGTDFFQDLSFTLNVSNVFDEDPPFYNIVNNLTGGYGYTNGSTYGRYVQIGIQKKF